MAVTTQQIIALERPLPEEQRFSAAALTQQLYTGIKGTLDKSKNDTTSNIYGPMERWNPELVLNSLTNYSGTITDYSGRREEIEAHDPLLGPVLTNYVAGRSAHLTTLKNAALPYLTDLMRRHNHYFRIDDVTHGNQKKTDRIVWALQGRFEHGKVSLAYGDWNNEFVDQLVNFPNSQLHDDLVDALAYIDQIQVVEYFQDYEEEEYEPMDAYAGY